MKERRRSRWTQTAWLGLAAGLAFILTGDQGAQTGTLVGIDPLEVMNSRVKPNIMFLVDTSGSMKWSVNQDRVTVGGDNPTSRLALVKAALDKALTVYQGQANFGLATFQAAEVNKTLSGAANPRQDYDGDGRFDGPMIYASTDVTAAYWAGRFNGVSDNPAQYTADPFQSFMNTTPYDSGQPAGCIPGLTCTYYIQSRLLRNTGSLFIWDTSVTPPVIVSETPGLFPTNCFAFEDGGGNNAVYCYRSAIFRLPAGGGAPDGCGQPAAAATAVAACTADSVPDIKLHLRPELLVDANGNPTNVTGAPAVIEELNPPVVGLRADQPTSIDQALLGAGALLPAPLGAQTDYIILITDNLSDSSLIEDPNNACGQTPATAVTAAATAAQNLFLGAKKIQTLVVTVGSSVNGVSVDRAEVIAHAGTGSGLVPNRCTPSDPTALCKDAFIVHAHTDPAEIAVEIEGAITSALDRAMWGGTYSAAQPIVASVFELGSGTSPSGAPVNPMDPRTRYDNRVNILYQSTFDVPGFRGHLLGFRNDGTFQPIGNNNTKGFFEVGETMFEKTSQAPQGLEDKIGRNGNLNEYVFEELHGNASVNDIDQGPGQGALLKRRVFTSPGNGDFQSGRSPAFGAAGGYDSASANGRNVVALWPPNQSGLSNSADVDPDDPIVPATAATGVSLDDALGIGPGSIPVLTFDELKARFGACDRSTDPASGPLPVQFVPEGTTASCDAVTIPPIEGSVTLATARKESRRIILAHIVGARVKRSLLDGRPMRAPVGSADVGMMYFEDRGWTFPNTTLSTPAVVTPPLRATPDQHVPEFVLFRDGRRDENRQGINEIDLGFGLRNPDFDDAFPGSKPTLKPIMTTIYIGAQDMLHAFRAGPNCGSGNPTTCLEQGGEELWGFIPFDLLSNQKNMILRIEWGDPTSRGYTIRGPNLPAVDPDPVALPNDRDHHTYGVASSIRVADIFVPGSFTPPPVPGSSSITFAGRWRTVLFFGRGPGGKFYTALDVTSPGPFTRTALKTNPPWVMWNQGNIEDVTDVYDGMGQTWSVPAVGNIANAAGSPEWVAFTGSGYGTGSNAANEGKTFYVLNALTGQPTSVSTKDGQVFPATFNVGDGTPTYIANNALVASAAGFNKFQLDDPTLATRSPDKVTRVFIPDLHGRIWKFPVGSWGNFGPTQPFANPVALLKLPDNSKELVFAESGNDPRVPMGLAPPFRAYGFEDQNPADSLNGSVAAATIAGSAFPIDMVNPTNTAIRYRGTVQPTTAFADDPSLGKVGRVFFSGTRFIPDLTGNGCGSTFDTILFAFGAVTGGAAYDFSGNANVTTGGAGFATMVGNRTTGIQAVGGQLIVGQSGGLAAGGGVSKPPGPPPPPAGGMPPPAPPTPPFLITLALKQSSAVCRSQ